MQFSNRYAGLPDNFFERIRPAAVREPRLFLWNAALAEELGLPTELTRDRDRLALFFGGNEIPPGSEPIAMAYAGHQFGHFVPQLGDGRAHLLGELVDRAGRLRDVQLKGSGPTSFSRGGDGRCALGPAVREFLMSEALHALGVPTTQSLAVVTSGQDVYRETELPGAIVTRVGASHIRVGTFEFFAARRDHDSLGALAQFAIERHYPGLESLSGPEQIRALLEAVIERQISLVVEWMRIGFIHGVMNTDNTTISGETIDYGPCAMMSVYAPGTVFSSIDRRGRYAFGNQPSIAGWNMARFAETLLPLISEDEKQAVAEIQPLLNGFGARFEEAWLQMMGRKLGIAELAPDDSGLVDTLLQRMTAERLDYTVTFQRLGELLAGAEAADETVSKLGDWVDEWRSKVGRDIAGARGRMQRHNPVVIPRNHHVEAVIEQSIRTGTPDAAERFLAVLRSPYEALPETAAFQDPPTDADRDYKTFCGT